MTLSRKSLFLIGGGIFALYWFFLRHVSGTSRESSTTISLSGLRETIQGGLQNEGFSRRQGYWWFLVSQMETAGFTSNLFRNFHNLFGMKQPAKRDTLSLGPTPSGFATFASDQDSVKDLALYLREFHYPYDFNTLDDQLKFMKSKGYFGDETLDSYRGKVIAWANKNNYPTASPMP